VVHEAKGSVREVAKDAARYKKLMQDLLVQVGVCRFKKGACACVEARVCGAGS
jgi:hypothetical protein